MNDTTHRPWPVPKRAWANAQSWVDLAFLHWRVDGDELRKLVGRSVELETFDGAAWIGVVPFLLSDLRPRGLTSLPLVSTFPELNVRTYVTRDGKPGVWFFSLDAASVVIVEAARRFYKLPYHHARMSCRRVGDHVQYASSRAGSEFSATYRGTGDLFRPEPGTLEYFLTERYCLYTETGARTYRAEIHHLPWDLQRGEASVDVNTMAPLALRDEPPHVLFSPRQDAVVWSLEAI
jgi:uncharacterized protein YqjF (DUF2071 family)